VNVPGASSPAARTVQAGALGRAENRVRRPPRWAALPALRGACSRHCVTAQEHARSCTASASTSNRSHEASQKSTSLDMVQPREVARCESATLGPRHRLPPSREDEHRASHDPDRASCRMATLEELQESVFRAAGSNAHDRYAGRRRRREQLCTARPGRHPPGMRHFTRSGEQALRNLHARGANLHVSGMSDEHTGGCM